LADQLDTIIEQSLDALTSAASGDSLCTLTGVSVQAAKYHEGQVVFAKQVKKALSSDPSLARRDVLQKWQAANPEALLTDPGWKSYFTGGVDMAEALAQLWGDTA
jgi:hypothetical protein